MPSRQTKKNRAMRLLIALLTRVLQPNTTVASQMTKDVFPSGLTSALVLTATVLSYLTQGAQASTALALVSAPVALPSSLQSTQLARCLAFSPPAKKAKAQKQFRNGSGRLRNN